MIPYIFAVVAGLSPVLQSAFDLPLQLAVQRAVLAGFLLWLFLRVRGGGLPRALAGREMLPLWAAAALSFSAMMVSPFRGYIFNEWGNFAAGLMIFLWASFSSADDRRKVEGAVLIGGWLVFGLSLLQAFVLGNFWTRPPLTNFNALALYAVMIVPLALERRSWALAAAMATLVIWTQSLGAALAGIAAAVFYAVSRKGDAGRGDSRLLIGGMVLLAGITAYLLQGDSIAGRLAWWRTAAEMFAARPLVGFGHASFAWAAQGFQQAGAFREYSIYAHNYYLEFLAENGLPAALAWFWLLFLAVRRRGGLAKYSVIAALVHSLLDFGLSVPANFWLFCWLLAERAPAEDKDVKVSRPVAAAFLIFALLMSGALLRLDSRSIGFEKAKSLAAEASEAGDMPAVSGILEGYMRGGPFRVPAAELMARAAGRNSENAEEAAAGFELLLLENRYSPVAWEALRRIYSVPGMEPAAAELAARRREVYR